MKGRNGVHELMVSNEELIKCINDGSDASEVKGVADRNGMKTLHQDSMLKVREGITTMEEAIATVSPDMDEIEAVLAADSEFKDAVAPEGR